MRRTAKRRQMRFCDESFVFTLDEYQSNEGYQSGRGQIVSDKRQAVVNCQPGRNGRRERGAQDPRKVEGQRGARIANSRWEQGGEGTSERPVREAAQAKATGQTYEH